MSGVRVDPAVVRALAPIKAAAARVNARLGVLPPTSPTPGGRRPGGRRRRARRPVPGRRLPDRLRHVDEHERQRGRRDARLGAGSGGACTRTTRSTPRSRATTRSRRPSTSRPPGPPSTTWSPRWSTSPPPARTRPSRTADVVKAGRTHLMDATPVTLGQELGGYAAQVRRGVERRAGGAPAGRRGPARRHRRRHRHQHPARLRRRGPRRPRRTTGLPLTEARDHFEAQGARDGLVELSGAAADGRGEPDQDLQRPALDGLRPARRARRDAPARPAARVVDHARQGQPGRARGGAAGVRAGRRARRDGRVGRGERAASS